MAEPDLQRLFESRLKPRLSELETRRRALRNTVIGGVLLACLGVGSCSAVFGAVELTSPSWERFGPLVFGLLSLGFFGVAIARFLVPGVTGYLNYRAHFKKEIVAEAVRAMLPGARYFADRSIPKPVFDESRLFTTRGTLKGDDLLQGTLADTPYEACELEASYKTGSGDDSRTVRVFHGLFLRVELDQDCAGRTLVQPPDVEEAGLRGGMESVSFDSAFDEAFKVWTTDKAGARALLDPALRARLIALADELGDLHLSFSGSQAIAAVDSGRFFEPSLGSQFDLAALQKLVRPLGLVPEIVRALVPEPRRRPAGAGFHGARVETSGLEALAAGGDVGMHQLLDAVHQEAESRLAGGGPIGPPANPYARLEDSGSEMTVDYPIGAGLIFVMLVTLALTPVVAAFAANLASPALGARLAAQAVQRVPALDGMLGLALEQPAIALGVAAFIYWMFAGTLLARIARVTVGSEGVAIRRLLPFGAVSLPLAVIRSVQQTNRSISFIRSDRSFLRSFAAASPILGSEAEALFLVQELRRGLQRAGWRPPVKTG